MDCRPPSGGAEWPGLAETGLPRERDLGRRCDASRSVVTGSEIQYRAHETGASAPTGRLYKQRLSHPHGGTGSGSIQRPFRSFLALFSASSSSTWYARLCSLACFQYRHANPSLKDRAIASALKRPGPSRTGACHRARAHRRIAIAFHGASLRWRRTTTRSSRARSARPTQPASRLRTSSSKSRTPSSMAMRTPVNERCAACAARSAAKARKLACWRLC